MTALRIRFALRETVSQLFLIIQCLETMGETPIVFFYDRYDRKENILPNNKTKSRTKNSTKNKKELFYEEMQRLITDKKPDDMEVDFRPVTKQNRKNLHAVTLSKPGSAAAPTFYLEDLYQAYLDGTAPDDMAESLIRFALENNMQAPPGNIQIEDYESVRKNLGLIVIGEERNREYLSDLIYEKIEDLALLPIIFTNDSYGTGNIKIKRTCLSLWNVSEETVLKEAKENAPNLMPLTFRQLGDLVGEESANEEELFVLSNSFFAGGAAVIFYPHVLSCIGNALGKDLFLLPSSVNEMIILTDCGQDPETLLKIVKEVNRTQVVESEQLTDAVYHYSREKDHFKKLLPA